MKFDRIILLAAVVFSIPTIFLAKTVHSVDEIVDQLYVDVGRSLEKQSFSSKTGRVDLHTSQFECNSAELRLDVKEQVDLLARAIEKLPNDSFIIVGHTGASENGRYNMSLSDIRAEAVFSYLRKNYQINTNRITPEGKGEIALKNKDDPVAAENRRGEIVSSILMDSSAYPIMDYPMTLSLSALFG